MKVIVITTIAQYAAGLDLHIRNLEWALSEVDYYIVIQTFSKNNLNIKNKKIKLINYDANPDVFFPFWDHASKILLEFLNEADVFLFIESDIFFTEKVDEDVYECYKKNIIINRLSDQYFSICDNKKNILYPHIWEGACLIPRKYIKMAIDENVNFGSNISWLRDKEKLISDYYTFFGNNFKNLLELIQSDYFRQKNLGFFETLFEFQFFAFVNNFNTNGILCGSNCEIGNKVVHFRGADSFVFNFHHSKPHLIESFLKTNSIWNLYINNCSFLFFINGHLSKNENLKKCLLRNYITGKVGPWAGYSTRDYFKEKIKIISAKCNEWMNSEELNRFNFVKSLLNNKNKIHL